MEEPTECPVPSAHGVSARVFGLPLPMVDGHIDGTFNITGSMAVISEVIRDRA